MKKIFVFTCAYNAESTIRRCLDSVINQSFSNFEYHIIDHGSIDRTPAILNEYATKNHSMTVNYAEQAIGGLTISYAKQLSEEFSSGYFTTLDADDEYATDYLIKMITFMQEHNLDIAACGNDFIDAQTDELKGVRKLEQNLILEGEGFNKHFPLYHQFMRTVWGKVYSLSVLRRCNFNSNNISYGSDTLFAIEAFRNAKRVGVLAESLHKYYISKKSISYMFDEKRIISDQVIFDATHDYLITKCGTIIRENIDFNFHVYLYAIKDTLNILLNSNISVFDKLSNILDIFQSRHTQDLINWSGAESQKSQLFKQVASWILSKSEVRSGSGLDIAADIFTAMDRYPFEVNGWDDGWVFILLVKIRDRQIEKGLSLSVDAHIISITDTISFLFGLNVGFMSYFRDIIFAALQNDANKALSQIVELIVQEKEIPDEYIEDLLMLALNLSAKLEYSDYFIYFKKLQISVLIDLIRIDEAIKEFADWDEILSDDIDFINLKERLNI